MKLIKSILLFISLISLFFIFNQFAQLYLWITTLNPIFSKIILTIFFIVFFYYIIFPIIKIFTYRIFPAPTINKNEELDIINERMKRFLKNKKIDANKFSLIIKDTSKDKVRTYNDVINFLKEEGSQIRKKYIINVFAGTTILQNGFFDALIIFSANIKMIKELFELYSGRFEVKDFMIIMREIYLVITISEVTEYAVSEILEASAPKLIKSIPFLGTVTESLTDGITSSMLTARIFFIVENHLSIPYIESRKDLNPGLKIIRSTVKDIVDTSKENISINVIESERSRVNNKFHKKIIVYLLERIGDKDNLKLKENLNVICNNYIKLEELFLQLKKINSNTVERTYYIKEDTSDDIIKITDKIKWIEIPENYRKIFIDEGKSEVSITIFDRKKNN